MELNTYQQNAMTTCMDSCNNFTYMFYNLLGEVGELVEKIHDITKDEALNDLKPLLLYYGAVAKKIRKEPNHFTAIQHSQINQFTEQFAQSELIQKECGDIMWQMNGIFSVLGWTSEQIHQQNLDKLASRKLRNQIDGNGDNR